MRKAWLAGRANLKANACSEKWFRRGTPLSARPVAPFVDRCRPRRSLRGSSHVRPPASACARHWAPPRLRRAAQPSCERRLSSQGIVRNVNSIWLGTQRPEGAFLGWCLRNACLRNALSARREATRRIRRRRSRTGGRLNRATEIMVAAQRMALAASGDDDARVETSRVAQQCGFLLRRNGRRRAARLRKPADVPAAGQFWHSPVAVTNG